MANSVKPHRQLSQKSRQQANGDQELIVLAKCQIEFLRRLGALLASALRSSHEDGKNGPDDQRRSAEIS